MPLVNNKLQVQAVISASGTLSTEGDIAPYKLVGIATDANWTASLVSLLSSLDGVNFLPVQGAAGALNYGTLAASSIMVLDPATLRFPGAIKVVSATTQTNTTTLTLLGATID
jgi:hypothetical protein